jgi:hypothetical protein
MKSAHRVDDGSTSAPETIRIVRCPNCGGESIYAPSNSARPFCSARCKNMDFGAWASESFRVPEPFAADGLDERTSSLQ